MSINIDLSNLTELKEIPKMTKTADGFGYPSEVVGKVFIHNGKLLFVNEKTVEEASIGMIRMIVSVIKSEMENKEEPSSLEDSIETLTHEISSIHEALSNFQNTFYTKIKIIEDKIENFTPQRFDDSDLISSIQKIRSQMEVLKSEMSSISDLYLELLKKSEGQDLTEVINKKIDEKLVSVYNNFKIVAEKLIQEEIFKIETDIKLKANKLTVGQISMFKEIGLSIDNIIELKKNNML